MTNNATKWLKSQQLLLTKIPRRYRAIKRNKVKSERVWQDKETEKLIGLYEARNCLWEVGNVKYSNRDEKKKAYAEIDKELKEFGIDRQEYKYKWEIIRGQFMRKRSSFSFNCFLVCPLWETWQNIGWKQCLRNNVS